MSNNFDLKEIKAILEVLDKYDVREFRLEKDEEKLFLKRGGALENSEAPTPPQNFLLAPGLFSQHSAPQHGQVSYEQYTQSQTGSAQPMTPAANAQANEQAIKKAEEAIQEQKKQKYAVVTSPMVGTFYRRPAVDAEAYVKIGDTIKKGDVLCIVEAMKLMNEIESTVSGKIVEICIEDGQMVEYGEVLFRVEE